MSEFNSNDINDAKRRVEEMRKKANNYIDTTQNEDKTFKNSSAKSDNKNKSPLSFLSDLTGSLFSSDNDGSQGLILALILILSKEGADSKLILALLYILL